MLTAWSLFLACATLIAVAGYRLAVIGTMIADRTGLGGTWIGVVLVATVTSLPELATGISSVTLADAPNIAVGDVLGSCVFNLALIAALDFLYRETPVYLKTSSSHILAAAFSIMLIGLTVIGLLTRDVLKFHLGHIGLYTPAILILYFVAVRTIYINERRRPQQPSLPGLPGQDYTMRQLVIGYAAAATAVLVAGAAMPHAAIRLADVMGWTQSFVGTLLVAGSTSLPEAASTIGALKLKAIDIAFGSLLGSNLFNMAVLALDDLAYLKGPILATASPSHALSGVTAMVMTGAVVVGLHFQPANRVLRLAGWVGLTVGVLYVLNALILLLSTG